jgi:hypothetical protein
MQREETKQRDVTEAAHEGPYAFWAHIVEMHAAKPKDPRLRPVVRGRAEAGCARGEVFMTIVDETGVYRSPVAAVKTFL